MTHPQNNPLKTLDDYALGWTRMGRAEFALLYGKPVLIGRGILGYIAEQTDFQRPATLLSIMPDEQDGWPSGENLIGRVWLLQKTLRRTSHTDITLGRVQPNDIVIQEFSVSRRQVVFHCEPSGVFLTDLDSRNGTFVNDQRLPPRKRVCLANRDNLRLGRFLCTFLTRQGFLETVELLGSALRGEEKL